jgi:hypothetical protein
VLFRSDRPDRYPLDAGSALTVNVFFAWPLYLLAAVLADRAVWLGIAVMAVSSANFLAHTLLFNIRGRSLYNPGMATALLLFGPLAALYYHSVTGLATPADWMAGLGLGALLGCLGVYGVALKMKRGSAGSPLPSR